MRNFHETILLFLRPFHHDILVLIEIQTFLLFCMLTLIMQLHQFSVYHIHNTIILTLFHCCMKVMPERFHNPLKTMLLS